MTDKNLESKLSPELGEDAKSALRMYITHYSKLFTKKAQEAADKCKSGEESIDLMSKLEHLTKYVIIPTLEGRVRDVRKVPEKFSRVKSNEYAVKNNKNYVTFGHALYDFRTQNALSAQHIASLANTAITSLADMETNTAPSATEKAKRYWTRHGTELKLRILHIFNLPEEEKAQLAKLPFYVEGASPAREIKHYKSQIVNT